MGSIREHNLFTYIYSYNLKNYFETGTGSGECLAYAVGHNFDQLYSVDIDEQLVNSARNTFSQHNNVTIFLGKSTDVLKTQVPLLPNTPTLFYLDAHFPGADFHKCTYEQSIESFKKDSFPLQEEVEIITSLRDTTRDVFVIDDLVLYEPCNNTFENEATAKKTLSSIKHTLTNLGISSNSKFLYDAFANSHVYTKDYRSQGYLIFTPKDRA